MNEFVPLVGVLEPMRNSLILIGLVLRTRSARFAAPPPSHVALAMMSPLNGAAPEVILNLFFTLAPGATGSVSVTGALAVQPAGAETKSNQPVAGVLPVLV